MTAIAIVGHGLSLAGSRRGDEIDGVDRVLRFAPARTWPPLWERLPPADVGRRIDIIAGQEKWMAGRTWGEGERWVWGRDDPIFLDAADRMAAVSKSTRRVLKGSRGMIAALWAMQRGFKAVVLYGCDAIAERLGGPYVSAYESVAKVKPHDYTAERDALEAAAAECGANLVFVR